MVFIKDEKAVSEIVGVMLLLLIGVVYLGVIQAYEVTEWNKELEMQHFDEVYNDFATLRSDLENVAINDIPKSTNINMGVRYPERFMLQNPGPGAYGTVSTYPLNVNISYETDMGIQYNNYTSIGIEYNTNGLLPLPKLVYENGLIIQDYGNRNISVDEVQKLTTGDNIYIPIINGTIGSVSSISMETFTILPMEKDDNDQQPFSSMNANIETRYPGIWQKLSENIDVPEGSQFEIDGNTIKITNIPGYGIKPKHQPLNMPDVYRSNELYSGMITINDYKPSESSGGGGLFMSADDTFYNIPPSDNFSRFIIRDIILEEDIGGKRTLEFSVRDSYGNHWKMELKFYYRGGSDCKVKGDDLCVDISQKAPVTNNTLTKNINEFRQIDLTSIYEAAGITQPNVLTVNIKNDDILYIVFDIE